MLITRPGAGTEFFCVAPAHTARALSKSPINNRFPIRSVTPTQTEIIGIGEYSRKKRAADALKKVSMRGLFLPYAVMPLCQILESPAPPIFHPARFSRQQYSGSSQ